MSQRAVVDAETAYQLPKFVELYKRASKVPEFKPEFVDVVKNSEEYKAFSKATGLPIALVSIKKDNDYIPTYSPFYQFYTENHAFWMIPCEIPGKKVIGFVLRSFDPKPKVGKKRSYCQFSVKGTMPIVYGLHNFGSFERNTTIFLVEGVKDALFLSQYYPYVISVLTNSVSDYICMMIQRLTDRIVFAFDIDADKGRNSSTRKSESRLTKRFGELIVSRAFLNTSRKVKDWANFFSTGLSEDQLRREMHSNMKHALDQVGSDANLLY